MPTLMKRFRLIKGITILLGLIPFFGYCEGSKELNKGCKAWSTYLYLCNDFNNHCTDTNGIRSQFATYDATIMQLTNPNYILQSVRMKSFIWGLTALLLIRFRGWILCTGYVTVPER